MKVFTQARETITQTLNLFVGSPKKKESPTETPPHPEEELIMTSIADSLELLGYYGAITQTTIINSYGVYEDIFQILDQKAFTQYFSDIQEIFLTRSVTRAMSSDLARRLAEAYCQMLCCAMGAKLNFEIMCQQMGGELEDTVARIKQMQAVLHPWEFQETVWYSRQNLGKALGEISRET
jgi:hypothetical protein